MPPDVRRRRGDGDQCRHPHHLHASATSPPPQPATTDTGIIAQDPCDWFVGTWVADGFVLLDTDTWIEAEVHWEFDGVRFRTWYSPGSERTGEYSCDWSRQLLNLDLPYDTAFELVDEDTFLYVNLSDVSTGSELHRQ